MEWPTLLLWGTVLALWGVATSLLWGISPVLSVIVTGLCITQYSSFQHEALHGHPTRWAGVNEAMASLGVTLTVPFGRFRETHLAHHHDPNLTDPYDDPESNFMEPAVWAALSAPVRAVYRANNTLLGRMVIGPILGNFLWLKGEWALIRAGDRAVRRDWALHALGLGPVVAWLWWAEMTWGAYLLAAWLGHGLLKIRTFLEHRAHEAFRARTVLVEDRGPLALLFLNNNYHVVHHCHPQVAWYDLPGVFSANRAHFLRRNEDYYFRSYAEIFRQYLFRAKDPVPHPIWPVVKAEVEDTVCELTGQVIRRKVGVVPELSKNGTPG